MSALDKDELNDGQTLTKGKTTNLSKSLPHRSASPAKRTASIMEGSKTEGHDEDTAMDEAHIIHESTDTVIELPAKLPAEPVNRTSPNVAPQRNRGASLDMVTHDRSGSSDSGICLTPRSRTSSSISITAPRETSGNATPSVTPTAELPSIDQQIHQVRQIAARPLSEGQKGYAVACKWLVRVLGRSSSGDEAEKYGKDAKEGPVGPVDNTGLGTVTDPLSGHFVDEEGEPYIPLRPGLNLGEDYEILPKAAWDLIIDWYGLAEGSPIIIRYCHNTSTNEVVENFQWELHPPVFTILKLVNKDARDIKLAVGEDSKLPARILVSAHTLFQDFLKRVKDTIAIELKTQVRIWRVLGGLRTQVPAGMMTPAQSRESSPITNHITPVDPGSSLMLDVNAFAQLSIGSQRELLDAKDETANKKYNGHSTVDIVGLRQGGIIVVEEMIGGPAGGEWISDNANRQAAKNPIAISVTMSGNTVVQDNKPLPKSNAGSGRTSPAPNGMITRGRQQKNGRTKGTTGLSNLGNTCYMNSALQCVRSVEELTQYFLLNKYQRELNPNNPLSHNGQVAKVYATLLHDLYNDNGSTSFAPRNFKNTIGKYGPSFSGYGQQDSQEFLLFLLDGLQEDLNRIYKKPYIEKPDSTDEMVNNPVALREMADKCWEIYKARNDSVVTDLFAGMYKSTVICPVCEKVSIIFDPFNNLTLQLPIENVWSGQVFFFPLHSQPVRLAIDIDKNASFAQVKEYVGKKVGVEPARLIMSEIYKCKFYKMFEDGNAIGEERINEGDTVSIHEVEAAPTNYPMPKKKGQTTRAMLSTFSALDTDEDDLPEGHKALAERLLIPVFNRTTRESTLRFQQAQKILVSVPFYIIVNSNEAKDEDAILRKVLAKVQTLTTKEFLEENGSDSAQEDSDMVLLSTDDGDSSTDNKLQAKSLDSEDGMIDISIQNASEPPRAGPTISYPPSMTKPRRVPHMLRSGNYITPEVRNLFEMRYIPGNGSETIPTGWSTLSDENKNYPTIQSRLPDPDTLRKQAPRRKTKHRFLRNESPPSSDEDVDDAPPPISSVPALQNDSDSDGLPPVERITNNQTRPRGGTDSRSQRSKGQKKKKLITYSNKGKKSNNETVFDDYSESDRLSDRADQGPLIRLGEAIILDWDNGAYDSLFGGTDSTDDNGMRGVATWNNVPLMPDPDLEEKRKSRIARKRNGVSLDDCLDEFGRAEILSENDAWYCPRCKEHRRASKKFELWKSPDILVIHLKRFSVQGRFRDKLDVMVDFPVEGLDLSSRVAMQEDGKSPIYDLFAVDNHYGGLGGGHYTAFAQNFFDKCWYEYNDSSVARKQNPNTVVTSAAYLLFYRRRASHPLGGPFFEQIFNTTNLIPDSQPTSRTASRSGEGMRLDDSSRNGSSSASREVGAVHQAGGGGPENEITMMTTETDLPNYSINPPPGTLEALEADVDVDETLNGVDYTSQTNPYRGGPGWTFANLPLEAEPAGEMEELFEGASNKAASIDGDTDRDQMMEFEDDQGTINGAFGTPERRPGTPVDDIILAPMEDEDGLLMGGRPDSDYEDELKID